MVWLRFRSTSKWSCKEKVQRNILEIIHLNCIAKTEQVSKQQQSEENPPRNSSNVEVGWEGEVEIEGLVGRVVASWCQVCLLTPSNRKFVCPTKMIILRRVQLNIYWSAKSSLLEISTQKLSSSRKLVFSSNSQTTFFGTTMVRFESENLKKTYTYVIGKNLTFVHHWLAADLGKLWSH